MQATEFQVESRLSGLANNVASRLNHWIESDRSGPMLETTMLGLRRRGHLCDYDRSLVDWLFGEQQMAFIMRGGEYLHPEGIPLLPDGALDVPPLQSGEAIFTQRLAAPHRLEEGRSLLRAARLSLPDEPDLIVGCLGCEDTHNRRADDDRFGRLVKRFRDAWERAERIEQVLRRRVVQTEPHLIICRTSGRIVSVSDSLAARLEMSTRELAGLEYGEIAARLTEGMDGSLLHLDNVCTEETFLCIASLRTRAKSFTPQPDPLLSELFVHKMKNKLSAIVAASSHLSDLLPAESDLGELLDVISDESARLDSYLDRLNLLACDKETRRVHTGIMNSLQAAVARAQSDSTPAPAVEFRGVRTERSIPVYPQSLLFFFDAILRAHRVNHRSHGITAIRINEYDTRTVVSFFTEWAEDSAGQTAEARWHEYAGRLAEALDISYHRRRQLDKNSVAAVVEIIHREEGHPDVR